MRDGYSRTQYTEDGHKLVEKSRMCFRKWIEGELRVLRELLETVEP